MPYAMPSETVSLPFSGRMTLKPPLSETTNRFFQLSYASASSLPSAPVGFVQWLPIEGLPSGCAPPLLGSAGRSFVPDGSADRL